MNATQTSQKRRAGQRILTAAVLGTVAALGLTACAGSSGGTTSSDSDNPFGDLASKGSVKLGVASVQPSSYVASDGTLTGAEVDTTLAVLKGLGIDSDKVEGTKLDFSSMIPTLQAKQVDLLSSSLFINADRCSQVSYSEPIYVGSFSVVTLNDSFSDSDRPETLQDVIDKGLTIGMPSGGAQEKLATDAGVPQDKISLLPNLRGTLDALKAGQIDAALGVDSQVSAALTGDEKPTVTIGTPLEGAPPQASAVAFRKDDTALRDQFNEELTKLKDDGTFDTIMQKYDVDPSLAKNLTTKQLCGSDN